MYVRGNWIDENEVLLNPKLINNNEGYNKFMYTFTEVNLLISKHKNNYVGAELYQNITFDAILITPKVSEMTMPSLSLV